MQNTGRLPLAPGPEFDLIRRFLEEAAEARADVRVGPGDDCAVVVGKGIALSSDLAVEAVHFRRDWLSPREIGYRAATAALSDLAAVAARPIGILVSLGVVAEDAGDAAAEVMAGARTAVETVGGVLLGGDLTRSPGPMVLDVTAVGEAAEPVLRGGGSAGHELWVTGTLGGAALAAARLLAGEAVPPEARERFVAPVARTAEALWLRERAILRAMLDLSDGLAGDAGHLAAASGVAVVLEPPTIPMHPSLSEVRGEEALALAVSGGEDYELCFAAEPGAVQSVQAEFVARYGIPLTRVGVLEAGSGVWWAAPGGGRVAVGRGGFQHFGEAG